MAEPEKCEECTETLYPAGERVSPGVYRQVDTHREVSLESEGPLPASLDGHAAFYVRVQHTWAQIHEHTP